MSDKAMTNQEIIAAFHCKRHAADKGVRCNMRTACCAYRKALSRKCPKCNASAGHLCRNLSPRRDLWQGWEPEPHSERKANG